MRLQCLLETTYSYLKLRVGSGIWLHGLGLKMWPLDRYVRKPMAELMESFYSTEWVSNNMGLLSTPPGSTGTDSCWFSASLHFSSNITGSLWLSAAESVWFKICLTVYKSLNGLSTNFRVLEASDGFTPIRQMHDHLPVPMITSDLGKIICACWTVLLKSAARPCQKVTIYWHCSNEFIYSNSRSIIL